MRDCSKPRRFFEKPSAERGEKGFEDVYSHYREQMKRVLASLRR